MHMSVTQFAAAPAMVNTARIRLALDRQSGDAKEYVGAIGGPHICSFVRMRRHPFANALHRHLLARNKIALHEHAADRGIGVTVVRGR
jgi:hypothetical protein